MRRAWPGLVVGLAVAALLWAVLFMQLVDVAPPRHPTVGAAIQAAADAGGHRWPGTSVRVRPRQGREADVERRWLGMRETTVRVAQTPAGWDVGTPVGGPARAVQTALACGLPGWVAGTLVARRSRRKRRRNEDVGVNPRPGLQR